MSQSGPRNSPPPERRSNPLIAKAEKLAAEKDYQAAVSSLRRLLEADPSHAEAHDALASLRETLELARRSEVERLLGTAESCLTAGAIEAAETVATQIFKLDPENQAALKVLEHSYREESTLEEEWQSQQPVEDGAEVPEDDHLLIDEIDRLLTAVPQGDPPTVVADQPPAEEGTSENLESVPAHELSDVRKTSPAAEIVDEPRAKASAVVETPPEPPPVPPAQFAELAEAAATAEPDRTKSSVGSAQQASVREGLKAVDGVDDRPPEAPLREAIEMPDESFQATSPRPTRKPPWWAIASVVALAVTVGLVLLNRDSTTPVSAPSGVNAEVVETPPLLTAQIPPETGADVSEPEAGVDVNQVVAQGLDPESSPTAEPATGAALDPALEEPGASSGPPVEQAAKAFDPPAVAAAPGVLSVNWKPWARVRIDDLEKETPCFFDLPPGNYSVDISNPAFRAVTRTVVIRSGQTTRLAGEFPKPGQLSINAVPWAVVEIEGEEKGQTPLTLSLPPGGYDVILRHPEHGQVSYSVRIRAARLEKIAHRY